MIISRIIGGLGNQMFQYAYGRALSLRHSTELVLDTDSFGHYNRHNGYELSGIFNISARVAVASDFHLVLGWRGNDRIRRALIRRRYSLLRGDQIIVEPRYGGKAPRHVPPGDCYLCGYWQSEQFFSQYQEQIRRDFTFRPGMSPLNQAVYEEIKSCDAIGLHVRRGDYVNERKASTKYASCSPAYYAKAIDLAAERCANPVLYVFSDDMPWVRENFQSDIPCRYIDHNVGLESYNDMRLMSACRHQIIANSTFSWWGAWLNPSVDKLVVAPDRWFMTQREIVDILPAEWVRI